MEHLPELPGRTATVESVVNVAVVVPVIARIAGHFVAQTNTQITS
jgi:hypothetical protein